MPKYGVGIMLRGFRAGDVWEEMIDYDFVYMIMIWIIICEIWTVN